MRQRYLEVTFRNGKPLAAYLYLPREGRVTVASTREAGSGLKVDFDAVGTPVGVEITAPSLVSVAGLNAVLERLGAETIAAEAEESPHFYRTPKSCLKTACFAS